MSALARTAVVAEMQARELLRRRGVLILLIALPVSFYLSVPASEAWGVMSGSIGVSWAIAAAGVFAVLGWRRADPRLALAGATPAQGFVGRFLLLQGLGLLLTAVFSLLLLARSSGHIGAPGVLVLALALMSVVTDSSDGTVARALVHSGVSLLVLLAVAWWAWHHRVRIAPSSRPAA